MPRSRHNPQFNRDTLPSALEQVRIGYMDLSALGGMRRPRPDSPNQGWNNPSFRAYADFMATPEFEQGLEELMSRARDEKACIMCAEAVPWRCHRSLIADALVVRGVKVEHILSEARTNPHTLRSWAHVEGTMITYPRLKEDGG